MIACPTLHAPLHVQSLMYSNLPHIVLRVQLLPSCSSQPSMMLHVQLLLQSNLACATLHPEQPCLLWPGRQRPLLCSCPCILSQAPLALFQPYWTLVHHTILFRQNWCMRYRNRVHSWRYRPTIWWSNLQIDRCCRAASVYWCTSIWWLHTARLCQVGRHIHVWCWIDCPLLWF